MNQSPYHGSPRAAHELQRSRPGYAPSPFGPNRQEIQAAKAHVVRNRDGIADARTRINHLEAALSRLDPQKVCACVVPGYTDPPERVERAKRDKQAGIVSVLTPDHARAIAAGEMEPPTWDGGMAMSHIHDLKRLIAEARAAALHIENHNAFLEYDLSQACPQSVCAAHVAGYSDPAERRTAADAAKAAGILPNTGVST